MGALADLFVRLRPDVSSFPVEVKRGTEGAAAKVGTDTGKTFGTGLMKGMASVFVAGAVVAGLKNMLGAASDLQQAMGGVQSVFQGSAKVIDDFGNRSAHAVGLSKAAFSSLAAPLGASLKLAGFSLDEVAGKTVQLTERAADMAATFGGTTKEALEAIQAALRGESDPIERFGVKLTEATVQAKAMADTGKTLASSLTEQEKAAARVALIMEQTAGTAGQFAREQNSAAGATQIATARIEDAKAKLATGFLPIVAAAAAAIGSLAAGFADLPGPVKVATVAVVGLGVATLLLAPRIAAAKVALVELGITSATTGAQLRAMLPMLGQIGVALAALAVLWPQVEREANAAAQSNVHYGDTAEDAARQAEVMRAVDEKLARQFEDGGTAREAAAKQMSEFAERTGFTEEQIVNLLPKYSELTGASKRVAEATGGVATAAEAAREELNKVSAAMQASINKALGLEDAQDAVALAVMNLRDQIKEQKNAHEQGAGAFTGNTRAAIANREAVRGIIGEYARLAEENAVQGRSNAGLRAELVKTLVSLGVNRQEAQRYANALGAIPNTITTTVTTRYISQGRPTPQLLRQTGGFADGGIVKFFAAGGLEQHVAQIVRDGMIRVWNEGEPGGEAYIPLSLTKRARSTAVLTQVARQFGYALVPEGGSSGSGGTASAARGWSLGTERLAGLLSDLIDAVERVAPGVARGINGASATAFQLGRAR